MAHLLLLLCAVPLAEGLYFASGAERVAAPLRALVRFLVSAAPSPPTRLAVRSR